MTFITLTNRGWGAYTPSPFPVRAHDRLPSSKFFLFFLPTPPLIFYFSHQFFLFSSTSIPFISVFMPFLPILFASDGFSLLLCVFYRPCAFRSSEGKKKTQKKRAGRMLCVLSALSVNSCHFLCRNDVLFFCGSIALTFPFIFGIIRS